MKYIVLIMLTVVFTTSIHAQVAIGKATPHPSAILDFGTDGDKGIVLPHLNLTDFSALPAGSLFYDANNSKVMFKGSDVIDLSVKSITPSAAFDVADPEYTKYSENDTDNGTIIGDTNSGDVGVLVLDSTTKVLALPVTTDYSSIGDPEYGTIVYDSTIKLFCVYDGEKWAFWGRK